MISWKVTTIKDFSSLSTPCQASLETKNAVISHFLIIFVSDCYYIVQIKLQQTRSDSKRNSVFSMKNGLNHLTRCFKKQADQTACYRILLNE